MKSEFQAKFLQNLLTNRPAEGFILIELLVVIIIIGILSAIALPSFLNQANKARESEAKQYVGSMNRAQQAAYLEGSRFTTDFGTLGLGIASNTTHYVYSMGAPTGVGATGSYDVTVVGSVTVVSAGTPANLTAAVIGAGSPKTTETLRSYVGLVDLATEAAGSLGGGTTVAVLCQKTKPGAITNDFATFDGTAGRQYPYCNTATADPLE
ncbi:type IV pilin-like G/H family protein [Prochlorothrix hollandica]|uniref:type IV pilin-like G/H family protein n=1 Tax=Prochlorothrix hollandica TaxID=1223 RepID=UPI000345988D|nr:type IV pilin-like G/H family protein [Prochlorothrix hollandica]